MNLKNKLIVSVLNISLLGTSFSIIKDLNIPTEVQAAYVTPYNYRGTWVGKSSNGSGYTKMYITSNSVILYFKGNGGSYYYGGTGYYKGKTHYYNGIANHGIYPKGQGEGADVYFHNGKVTLLIAGTKYVCHKV